jgi:5-methylcytosine-specific restriction endonuclease McrA
MERTLVLDQGYQPHRVVTWQRAVTMLFAGKVEVVEEYDQDIRSVSISIKMPAVVRMLRRFRGRAARVRFSRINVMARDKFRCQYCGTKLPMSKLSFDHVVPRSQGGKTSWDNIVTACLPCNVRKGNRAPEQAGMRLRSLPRRPVHLVALVLPLRSESIPEAWQTWVYWQAPIREE